MSAAEWAVLALIVVFVVSLTAWFWGGVREERRRNDAFVETMRELSSRCPDCRGMGWHFGPPGTGDPKISTPTCQLCEGTGRINERTEA